MVRRRSLVDKNLTAWYLGQRSAQGGYLPLATGVSTVRYPITQRTFKYVATVQSVTDETCHKLTCAILPRCFRLIADDPRRRESNSLANGN